MSIINSNHAIIKNQCGSMIATKIKATYKSPEVTEIQINIEKNFAASTGSSGEDGNWIRNDYDLPEEM